MEDTSTCRPALLGLPPELHSAIYYYALAGDEAVATTTDLFVTGRYGEKVVDEPGILSANHRLRKECLPIFYSANTFECGHSEKIDIFLQKITREKLAHVQRLRAFDVCLTLEERHLSNADKNRFLSYMKGWLHLWSDEFEKKGFHKDAVLVLIRVGSGVAWVPAVEVPGYEKVQAMAGNADHFRTWWI